MTMAMDQPASTLFTAAYQHDLRVIEVREICSVNIYCLPQLSFTVSFILRNLLQIDRVEEFGDVEMVHVTNLSQASQTPPPMCLYVSFVCYVPHPDALVWTSVVKKLNILCIVPNLLLRKVVYIFKGPPKPALK